jgi:hypothetical protein
MFSLAVFPLPLRPYGRFEPPLILCNLVIMCALRLFNAVVQNCMHITVLPVLPGDCSWSCPSRVFYFLFFCILVDLADKASRTKTPSSTSVVPKFVDVTSPSPFVVYTKASCSQQTCSLQCPIALSYYEDEST